MADRSTNAIQIIEADTAITGAGTTTGVATKRYKEAVLMVEIQALTTAYDARLNVTVEVTSASQTDWYVHPAFRKPWQFTATGKKAVTFEGLGDMLRLNYTVDGTSPSITTHAELVLKN